MKTLYLSNFPKHMRKQTLRHRHIASDKRLRGFVNQTSDGVTFLVWQCWAFVHDEVIHQHAFVIIEYVMLSILGLVAIAFDESVKL